MMKDLMAITDNIYEDYGSFTLTRSELREDSLLLFVNIHADEYPDAPPHWEVTCSRVREHSLTLGEHYDFEFTNNHILILPHISPWTTTSFYGKAENPGEVVSALYKKHRELVEKWIDEIPFHKFLNPMKIEELIAGGFGMLAEGPEFFVYAYENVMQQYGFSTSHTPSRAAMYFDEKEIAWIKQQPVLSILVIGNSYIIAESFDAKISKS